MPPSDKDGFCEEDRDLLIKTKAQVDFIQQTVWELKKDIRGNGRPGLLSRMDRAEARLLILTAVVLGTIGVSGGLTFL